MRFLSLFFVGFVSVNGMEANKFCACLSKLFSKTTSVSLSYKEIQNQMKNLQGSLEEQSKKASFSAQKTEDLERKNKQLDSFVDGWIEKYNNSVFALGERDETIKDLQKDLEKKEGELIKLLTIIEELKQYNDQLEKDLAKSKTKINEAETEYGMLMQQYEASMRQNIREGWTQELTLEEYEDDEYGFEVLNNNELKEEEQPLLNDPHL